MKSAITKSTKNKAFVRTYQTEIIVAVPILMVAFIYAPTLKHDFVNYDDTSYVTENRNVNSGLSLRSIGWAFTSTEESNWHPLTWISHMLDVDLYGLNPGGHHLTNMFLHMLNTLILFALLKSMTGTIWRSAFVAALFAIHPLHVESVAWIAERKDLLCAFFWFLALWSYTYYVKRPSLILYLLVSFFFISGLLSKPMIITFPFLLLLLDYWPLNRYLIADNREPLTNHWKKLIQLLCEKIPFFILSLGSVIVTYMAQHGGGAVDSLESVPLFGRIGNGILSYATYLVKTVWPLNLAFFYPFTLDIALWQVILSGFFLTVITILAIITFRRLPYFVVGWFWYLGTLIPVIGIVKVGMQAMADRYTYVPLIGIFILFVWSITNFTAKYRYRKQILTGSGMILLAALMILTSRQISHWQNSYTLFRHAINTTSKNFVAHSGLARTLKTKGMNDEAIKQYEKALEINPFYTVAHYNFGTLLAGIGRIDEAIEHFSKTLQIDPQYAKAHNNIGTIMMSRGDRANGIEHFKAALKIDPAYKLARLNLGNALSMKEGELIFTKDKLSEARTDSELIYRNEAGDFDKLIEKLEKALASQPNDAALLEQLTIAYIKAKEYEKALPVLEKKSELNPDNAKNYYNLACIHALLNNPKQSLALLKKSIDKGYDNWNLIRNDADLKNIRNTEAYREIIDNLPDKSNKLSLSNN